MVAAERLAVWVALFLALGCGAANPPGVRRAPLGLDELMTIPAANPSTAAKVALGERLFFERSLSLDHSLSCASCHRPDRVFSDTSATSVGVGGRRGRRNAPTLINRAYARSLFWDGRVTTLEEQVIHPIQDSLEMALPLGDLVSRLAGDASYRADFRGAFGADPSATRVAFALASYVRTLRSADAPVDRWRAGDTTAMSAPARLGMTVFMGKGNCTGCHVGPNFSDEQFHNTGVAWRTGMPVDSGRFSVTGDPADVAAFKTPTLRAVACTAPYMHDGSLGTIEDVIDFYDRGGHANPRLDDEIHPLHLSSAEKHGLASLLRSFGAPCPVTSANGESSESDRRPEFRLFGHVTSGGRM